MVAAGWLFVILGIFGLCAGTAYSVLQQEELAGIQLLFTFCLTSTLLGVLLLRFSPAARRHRDEPDMGGPGSAHPERGAADEHGNIHTMAPTLAPFVYSVGAIVLLAGVVYRDRLWGPWGIALGLAGAVAASAMWFRNVSADTRMALEGGGHEETGGAHGPPVATIVPDVPSGPPGPANYFEQIRQAMEAGDSEWAADAYALDGTYFEPANPPHLGRESIRAYWNDFGKGHRNLSWHVERMAVNGNVALVEWTMSFGPPANRRTGQPGLTVIEVGDGGITYHRDYFG
jgi:hypothetical protein